MLIKLIMREINDRIICFAIAIILAAIVVGMMLLSSVGLQSGEQRGMGGFLILILIACTSLFYALGLSQIHSDRNQKVLAFLSTLSVTRPMMFLSKILTGLIAIGLFFVPSAIAINIASQRLFPSFDIQHIIVSDLLWSAFFISLAGYSIGLATGWNNSKVIPTLGGMFLTLFFCSIVIIKGLHPGDLLPVVGAVIVSCIFMSWRKFMAESF